MNDAMDLLVEASKQHRQECMRVFISYARSQVDTVSALCRGLEMVAGLEIDAHEIDAGDKQKLKLAEMIGRVDFFLIFLSEQSVTREWVKWEFELASVRERQSGRKFIIPICLPDVTPSHETVSKLIGSDISCLLVRDWCEDAYQVFRAQLHHQLLRLAGRQIIKWSPDVGAPKGEEEPLEATTRRLAEIDFPSLLNFYHKCKDSVSGVFFNVQVSADEWFAPNMQIHLAVQEGMATRIRWAAGSPKADPKSVGHMPFRRVAFLDKTRDNLKAGWRDGKPWAKHLSALMHMHTLMACPLAIVTAESFALRILADVKHRGFFEDARSRELLGLQNRLLKRPDGSDEVLDIVELTSAKRLAEQGGPARAATAMERLIQEQANDKPGLIEGSMDFAVFKKGPNGHSANGESYAFETWGGKVGRERTKEGEVNYTVYYHIPMDDLKFAPRHPAIATTLDVKNKELATVLQEFSRIVEGKVFRPDNEDVVDFTQSERTRLSPYHGINPLASELEIVQSPCSAQIIKVQKDYCPWIVYDELKQGPYGDDVRPRSMDTQLTI